MSGKLVGDVIAAMDQLRERGLTARGFQALIAIAEKCHPATRQAAVPWSWIQRSQFGSSLPTAKRAVRSCREAGAVRVVKRGFNNQNGRSCAPIYELLPLTERITQVTQSVGDRTDHPGDTFAPDRTDQIGDRTDQIGDRTDHPGDPLNGSINGSSNGSASQDANNPEPVEPPEYCQLHPEGTIGNCGPCGAARRKHERWQAIHERWQAECRRAQAQAREHSIAACGNCDEKGWLLDADGTTNDHGLRCTENH